MSFSDWTVFNNGMNGTGGQPSAGVSTTYFGGSSALVFSGAGGHGLDDGGLQASASAVPNTLTTGITSGKIRTLITPVLSGPANHGLICMQSSLDMQAGHGYKGYAVMLDSVFFDEKVVLVRMNDGISPSLGGALGSNYSLLGQTANDVWIQNNVYGLEIEWHVDTALGGIHVIGRFGSATDFSDLTTFAECLDTTSHAQLTTVGEGPYAALSTNGLIVAFDNVLLTRMTPV